MKSELYSHFRLPNTWPPATYIYRNQVLSTKGTNFLTCGLHRPNSNEPYLIVNLLFKESLVVNFTDHSWHGKVKPKFAGAIAKEESEKRNMIRSRHNVNGMWLLLPPLQRRFELETPGA